MHRRARLLAYITAILVVTLLFFMALFWAAAEGERLGRYLALVGSLAALLAAALLLNRGGYYRPAATLAVAAALVGPWASMALDPRILQGDLIPLAYTAVPVFLASLLLSARHTALVAGVQIALLFAVSQWGVGEPSGNWPSLIFLLAFIGILNLIAARLARLDLDQIERQGMELGAQKSRLQAIIDSSPLAISVKDLDGRYLLVNRFFRKVWGLDGESVIGSRDADLFSLDGCRFHGAADGEVRMGGAPLEVEETVHRPEGEQAWHTYKFPLKDDRGSVYALGAVSTDVTERKRREEAVRAELGEQRKSIERAAEFQRRQTVSRVPCLPGLACAAVYEPSERLGGDFLYLEGHAGRLLLVAADCTGHGLAASITAALLKSLVDRHLTLLQAGNPDAFLSRTGRDVGRYFPPGQYPVMFAALFDPSSGALRYANANYPLPWRVLGGRSRRLASARGMHLGFDEDTHFAVQDCVLEPGESLLVSSDALEEIIVDGVNQFPEPALTAALSAWKGGVRQNLADLCEAVARVHPFPLQDDLSIVLLERLAPVHGAWTGATPAALAGIRTDVERLMERGGCLDLEKQVAAANLAAFLSDAWTHGASKLDLELDFDGATLALSVRDRSATGWAAPWVESVRECPPFHGGSGKSAPMIPRWSEERQSLVWSCDRIAPQVLSAQELLRRPGVGHA
ncbi:MAG: SpoIIE family protein phosphatase [Spirochaetes bacterium]|nr:SpoIIE family protein phosphatase [Spirochaetota bacterium]